MPLLATLPTDAARPPHGEAADNDEGAKQEDTDPPTPSKLLTLRELAPFSTDSTNFADAKVKAARQYYSPKSTTKAVTT